MNIFATFTAILFALFVLDAVYIQFIYGGFSKMISRVQGSPIRLRWESAVICYLVLASMLYYFIILPGRPATDAALLGFGTYAVYETTSYALLKDWELHIAVIDSLWGGALFYLATMVVHLVA
jgi:uncharacterized membrane protein